MRYERPAGRIAGRVDPREYLLEHEFEKLLRPRRPTAWGRIPEAEIGRTQGWPHSEPPKVIIKSLNPEYQTYERDAAEVSIVGRVIWAAKQL